LGEEKYNLNCICIPPPLDIVKTMPKAWPL
jgi:hypothetical protein